MLSEDIHAQVEYALKFSELLHNEQEWMRNFCPHIVLQHNPLVNLHRVEPALSANEARFAITLLCHNRVN